MNSKTRSDMKFTTRKNRLSIKLNKYSYSIIRLEQVA